MKTLKIIEKTNLWLTVSCMLIGLGVMAMSIRAIQSLPVLNLGVDFSGGSTMQLQFEQFNQTLKTTPDAAKKRELTAQFIQSVRSVLAEFNLQSSTIQTTETGDLIIKTSQMDSTKHDKIHQALKQKLGKFEVLELDFIGPTIGSELKTRSVWIVLLVCSGLMGYITFRFGAAFGLATLAATIHDALIMISFAALFHIEINVEFIAAILTILGYSMNDTVVIFDRIRENLSELKTKSLATVVNMSLKQTLSRTFYTVLTTLIMTASLFILGGPTLREFSLMLLVGICIGTYSSLFVAAPVFAKLYAKHSLK
jgi:preprotein translocase subunit SecF